MSDDSFSIKEVLKERFDEVNQHLVEIKTQTTKTNGRVTSLEKSRAQIWIALIVTAGLIGTIAYLYMNSIDAKIDARVGEALKAYEPIK